VLTPPRIRESPNSKRSPKAHHQQVDLADVTRM
jgi:hypothetical protein